MIMKISNFIFSLILLSGCSLPDKSCLMSACGLPENKDNNCVISGGAPDLCNEYGTAEGGYQTHRYPIVTDAGILQSPLFTEIIGDQSIIQESQARPIAYHAQQREDSASIASVRMVVDTLCGFDVSEESLKDLFNIDDGEAIPVDRYNQLNKKYNLEFIVSLNNKISEINSLIKEQNLVIVNFPYPNRQSIHTAVVQGVTSKEIFFADPWCGANCVMDRESFEKISKERNNTTAMGTLLAIKLKDKCFEN